MPSSAKSCSSYPAQPPVSQSAGVLLLSGLGAVVVSRSQSNAQARS
eukprot:COSAG05_NODE_1742_length_4160_cov_2.966511_1_plen_46_part_00